MRVAAIYDIHANLPALEAVCREIREGAVDLVVVGGDVLPGPMPRESLDLLESLDTPVRYIQGNGEREVLAVLAGAEPRGVPEPFRPVVRWVARQLLPEQRRRIAGWPLTLTLDVPGLGEVVFCHATPRSDTELFTRLTPEEEIVAAFAGSRADLVVCGHTHMPFERWIGGIRVLNAGSAGMPFGRPGAHWLLLHPGGVQFRCTTYDVEAAAARIRSTDYPHAADFAANNVLAPPPEERMLEAFTRASVRREQA